MKHIQMKVGVNNYRVDKGGKIQEPQEYNFTDVVAETSTEDEKRAGN